MRAAAEKYNVPLSTISATYLNKDKLYSPPAFGFPCGQPKGKLQKILLCIRVWRPPVSLVVYYTLQCQL